MASLKAVVAVAGLVLGGWVVAQRPHVTQPAHPAHYGVCALGTRCP